MTLIKMKTILLLGLFALANCQNSQETTPDQNPSNARDEIESLIGCRNECTEKCTLEGSRTEAMECAKACVCEAPFTQESPENYNPLTSPVVVVCFWGSIALMAGLTYMHNTNKSPSKQVRKYYLDEDQPSEPKVFDAYQESFYSRLVSPLSKYLDYLRIQIFNKYSKIRKTQTIYVDDSQDCGYIRL
mmetsp:Transcript_12046/g.17604  ORF Transcript_12046/g.17604 Transcript_12046/m.17604 type:complete len:188 (+) Transcript_12046:485-1048(+)|eukprot:CAMPEP_0202428188 /NCGR_PEP_ID=MMETSP1345-20130828/2251_1 /ASSEMBLY_ACC=CAM_ASM_000843 /TAXON_ID=342563 /ORGANISM="Fabrea Fabrea salina" /LENGTH=187 /DNA_ID=CAMNT_0049039103 /DNA_START=422 /DNA_END=985 /DNA_ORIENTATION=+